jgi:hypothetical protein
LKNDDMISSDGDGQKKRNNKIIHRDAFFFLTFG